MHALRNFFNLFKPMTKLPQEGFWDSIAGEKVNYYLDYKGRAWMATNSRQLFNFRSRVEHYDMPVYKKAKNL